jgi:predicted RNase H-like HicB family nuclease
MLDADTTYIETALTLAHYEQMEDGTWYASIPGFDGLYATATTENALQHELREMLRGWLHVHVEHGGNTLPTVKAMNN